MALCRFLENGLLLHTVREYTEDELKTYLQDGYHEVTSEDLELYETLQYLRDPATGKPILEVIPEPSLDTLKAKKLREVDSWTAQKITGGFVSECSGEAVTYDSDKDTQLTMQGICINVNTPLFAEKYPNGCPVRGYAEGASGKSVFMLTHEQVMRWQADLSIHIGDCKVAGWQKQAEVQAAQSKEELEAIILD